MALRTAAALTVLMLGLAGSVTLAAAQSPFYRPLRPLPPIAVDDDDLDDAPMVVPPPGVVQGYPLSQQGAREERPMFDRFGRRIEPYPPYPPQSGSAVLSPPGFLYPDEERRRLPDLYREDTARLPQRPGEPGRPGDDVMRPPAVIGAPTSINPQQGQNPDDQRAIASLPPEDQPEIGEPKELPPHLKRQMVDYATREPVGTLVIDTQNTYLYLVLGNGKAMRYGIGVGREGFTWAGAEKISKMAEWPDWHPPAEMIERQPYLPRFMAGGLGNPLGARALYLGKTLYRIHGTNQPSTIGTFVSSGCIRLINGDVEDLYSRVKVGTRVVVLPGKSAPATASAAPATGSVGGPSAQALPPVNIAPATR